MRKPLGVIVAAVILALATGLGLAGTAVELSWTLLIHNPLMPAGPLGHHIRVFLAVFNLILACILAFCAWTVVGLVRMRTWARYSIMVLGILMAVYFGALSVLILFMSKFVRGPMAAPGAPAFLHPGAVFVALSLPYAAIALIGIWWVVYFNLKPVREAFAAARTHVGEAQIEGAASVQGEYGFWHLVVIALAILMLIGGVGFLAIGVLHLPLYFFGFFVQGEAVLPAALVAAALEFYIGIGLLRRSQAAYWTAIGWQVFGLLMTLSMSTPAARVRMVAFQEQFGKRFSTAPVPTLPYNLLLRHWLLIVSIAFSVIFLGFLYALLRCRRWYVSAPGY